MNTSLKVFASILVALACKSVWADVPRFLGYQGFLTDTQSTPLSTTVSMQFALYATASGGVALYSESQSVSVTNGRFSVRIGPIPAPAAPFDAQYYLGVTVGADAELMPRVALDASPYALRSDVAAALAGQIGAGQIADGAVTGPKLAPASVTSTAIADGAVSAGKLAGNGCGIGQVLKSTGGAWACADDANSGGTVIGINAGPGLIGSTTNGIAMLSLTNTCGGGQILKFDGNAWGCANDADSGGTIVAVNPGSGLTGSTTNGVASLSLATPVAINLTTANSVIYGENFGGGPGVKGFSASGYGVLGASTGAAGVRGDSSTAEGVSGTSSATVGTYGGVGSPSSFTLGFIDKAGVWGNSQNSVGVWGTSTSNVGVAGASASNSSAGVYARGASSVGTALEIAQGGIKVTGAGLNTFTAAFVHTAKTGAFGNTCADPSGTTQINHPLTNGHPEAILIVTPSWVETSPPSSAPVGVGVYYFAPSVLCGNGYQAPGNTWWLFTQANIVNNQRFNILVISP